MISHKDISSKMEVKPKKSEVKLPTPARDLHKAKEKEQQVEKVIEEKKQPEQRVIHVGPPEDKDKKTKKKKI